ncbi:2-hydroxy-acid oxidase, partial [Bradyrhizobium sp. NAS96.2]
LIWAAVPPSADAQATLVRGQVEAIGGHATLLRATEDMRRAIDVFQPQPAGLAALGERVRASFDPRSILNRGRMTKA